MKSSYLMGHDAGEAAPARDERNELVRTIHELYTKGLIAATGGNVSVRIPGTGHIWITPCAYFEGNLGPDAMVRLDLQGGVRDDDSRTPSSEWRVHCAVYGARPDVEAAIHAHAPYATILALTGLPFLPISAEAAFLGDVPRVAFAMPGTKELADAVAGALAKGRPCSCRTTASWLRPAASGGGRTSPRS